MNKFAIIALALLSVAVAAYSVVTKIKNNPTDMTTEQLWKSLEEARDNRLPQTAKPLIKELRKRIVNKQDTPSMFRLLEIECQVREHCYGEFDDKVYSDEEWREKSIKEARELWTPVREVLLAGLYQSDKDDVTLQEILVDHEDELTAMPLDAYISENDNEVKDVTLWDATILSLPRTYSLENSILNIWQSHIEKTGSDVSANLLSIRKIDYTYSAIERELAVMKHRSKSETARMLTAYVEGVYSVNQAIALKCADDKEIAECKSLISHAIEILTPISQKNDNLSLRVAQTSKDIINRLTTSHVTIGVRSEVVDPRLMAIPVKLGFYNIESVDFVLYPNDKVNNEAFLSASRSSLASCAFKSWNDQKLTTKGSPIKKLSQEFSLPLNELIPSGEYCLAAYSGESLLSSSSFPVSQLSVSGVNGAGKSAVIVADALNGAPKVGASVADTKTDKDGIAIVEKGQRNNRLLVSDGNESLKWSFYNYYYGRDRRKQQTFHELVTDRAIYRPGQTIYFKLWSYNSLNGDMSPVLDEKLKISLMTADSKRTVVATVTTNAWGTASGEFTIPEDVYCGHATIIVNNDFVGHIQIDEYKRTGINITFPTIQSVIKVGEKAVVKGIATQVNGNPVANANVVWSLMGSEEGNTTTDNNGEFSMEFNVGGHYSYNINVKVTDLKGETCESSTTVNCTQEGSHLSVDFLSNVLVQGEDLNYSYSLKNDNNGDWSGNVTVTVNMLSEGNLADVVSTQTKTVTGTSNVVCKTDDMTPGAYRISFKTTLANGSEYDTYRDIVVISKADSKQSGLPKSWNRIQRTAIVGESVQLRVASSFKESMVYAIIYADGQYQSVSRVPLSRESKTISVAMPNKMPLEGEAHLFLFTIGQGETLNEEIVIQLKSAKPKLPLSLTTFRDTSSPKSHEKWTLKLGNSIVVAPQAEVVLSMYDARLDNFAHNLWDNIYFNENRYSFPASSFASTPVVNNEYNQHDYFSDMYSLYINQDIFPRVKHLNIKQVQQTMLYSLAAGGMMKQRAMSMAEEECFDIEAEMMPMAVAEKNAAMDEASQEPMPEPAPDQQDIPRENFAETVFFYPHLTTDNDGSVVFEFDLPDNITSYNFQAFAHTKDMQHSYMTQKLNVRKELSVTMGAPRFAVEGDVITLTALLESYDKSLSQVECTIQVKDAEGKEYASKTEMVPLNGATSAQTALKVTVPSGVDNLTLSVSAKGNNHQDTEITTMQVTKRCVETHESLPFVVIGKKYSNNYENEAERLDRQKKYGNNNLTFKYNSNAFVEVVDALPYLDEEWSKSADTYLGRVESSAIALLIKSRPDVQKAICGAYKLPRLDDEGYNTPWHSAALHMDKHTADIRKVLSGNEAERTLKLSLRKLHELQKNNGSIAWFPGMEGSDYMTVAVAEMLGRMIQMGLISGSEDHVSGLCNGAKRYMDNLISKEADEMRKHKSEYVGSWTVDLLYARALMPGKLSADAEYIISILKKHAQKEMSESYRIAVATLYNQIGAKEECQLIVRSLIENLQHAKLGLASVHVGRFFYPTYAEIYSQSLLTILLGRMDAMGWNGQNDNLIEVRNQLLNWLIFQKRSTYWRDRQSTSIAVLAVMGANADMTSTDEVQVGADSYTCTIEEPQLLMPRKSIESVKISKSQEYPSWGAWQWTETTPQDELVATGCDELTVTRAIFVQRNGKFEKLKGNLKVGDVIKVELTLRATVDMSFVHLRDHKAASFEHRDQTSNYVYSLWWRHDRSVVPHYYQPHDTHIDFFIEHLAKGENNLSYEATVTNAGDISAGFAEVQCTFTPELVAKSAGSRIVISNIIK
ncbi:MAG: MG2 domain-containing protein [Bacteroidales bacterium]|nr:MG2 domain-containing protein [Bacteroidales bacterium]